MCLLACLSDWLTVSLCLACRLALACRLPTPLQQTMRTDCFCVCFCCRACLFDCLFVLFLCLLVCSLACLRPCRLGCCSLCVCVFLNVDLSVFCVLLAERWLSGLQGRKLSLALPHWTLQSGWRTDMLMCFLILCLFIVLLLSFIACLLVGFVFCVLARRTSNRPPAGGRL